jgi:hypothetical protein
MVTNGNETIKVNFINNDTNESYDVSLYCGTMSFTATYNSKNRIWNHLNQNNNKEKHDNSVTKKELRLISVSVGDLLKHFYYKNRENVREAVNKRGSKSKYTNNDEVEDPSDKSRAAAAEDKKFSSFVKNSLSVDTYDKDLSNSIGTYIIGKEYIYEWNSPQHFKHTYNNFQEFCAKKIYFGSDMIYKLMSIYKNYKSPMVDEFFNTISSKALIMRLYRYYTYNESLSNPDEYTVIHFDEPQSLDKIAQMITNDNELTGNQKYYIGKINKKSNNNQTANAQRFEEFVIDNIRAIPISYPLAAYNKIKISKWCTPIDGPYLAKYIEDKIAYMKLEKYKHSHNHGSDKHNGKTTYIYKPKADYYINKHRNNDYDLWSKAIEKEKIKHKNIHENDMEYI